jgi:hypothetical protein
MGEREFIIYLDPDKRYNRYRHYHVWKENQILEFRVQFEALIDEAWYPIVRYDTAHGKAHRDLIHADGSETKEWFNVYTVAEVLTISQRDIMENWMAYRDHFEKELKK